MHVQCHGKDTGDQNWKSKSKMTQTPEWHKHLETPLGVWIPRWCWERGGKLGCRHQTVSPCLGGLERKEVEGSVATEKQWGRKIYWSLSPFSHLFPLPSAALAKLLDEFSYSQLGFFLWSHAVLCSQMASPMPLCFPSVKHIIKTHSFQKVIYTLITLHIKYLGIFKGKQ